MSKLCPICSEELESAITFSIKTFDICFDCFYVTEPVKFKPQDERM